MPNLQALSTPIALRQFGLITRKRLRELGFSANVINYAIRVGELVRVHPAVYRLAGSPVSFDQLLMAALLASKTDAAVSHRAAAWVWKFEGIKPARPEISIQHPRKVRLAGVRVHRVPELTQRDVTSNRGLLVTTPARTICDLASALSATCLEDVLDDGLRRKLLSLDSVRRQLVERTRNTATLRQLLTARSPREVSGSSRENELRRLLVKAGLPKPDAQHEVFELDGSLIARVDFAYPAQRLAIEYDGRHHADRRQWTADLARQNRLINAGWRILRYTHDDLVRRPNEVVAEVSAALRFPDGGSKRRC